LGVAIDSLQRVAAETRSSPPSLALSSTSSRIPAHLPAAGCITAGASVLAFATYRYYYVQKLLKVGQFPVNFFGVAVAVLSTSALTMVALSITVSDDLIDTTPWLPLPTNRPKESSQE
jgi:hypothetical protein